MLTLVNWSEKLERPEGAMTASISLADPSGARPSDDWKNWGVLAVKLGPEDEGDEGKLLYASSATLSDLGSLAENPNREGVRFIGSVWKSAEGKLEFFMQGTCTHPVEGSSLVAVAIGPRSNEMICHEIVCFGDDDFEQLMQCLVGANVQLRQDTKPLADIGATGG